MVTDAYLASTKNQTKFQVLIDEFALAIRNANITLPGSVEVFMESANERCLYYMIDHATRTIFWLHPITTEDLLLQPVVSDSHLSVYDCFYVVSILRPSPIGIQLEGLYWQHVEYFPAHQAVGYDSKLNELTDAMIQGRAGR